MGQTSIGTPERNAYRLVSGSTQANAVDLVAFLAQTAACWDWARLQRPRTGIIVVSSV